MTQDEGSAEPLDPALEKVRRKMIRLLAVSIAVLMVGLIAVLSAVVYRAGGSGREAAVEPVPAEPALNAIAVPAGSRIAQVAPLARDRALLLIERADGAQELVLFEPASGAVVSRTRLDSATP